MVFLVSYKFKIPNTCNDDGTTNPLEHLKNFKGWNHSSVLYSYGFPKWQNTHMYQYIHNRHDGLVEEDYEQKLTLT